MSRCFLVLLGLSLGLLLCLPVRLARAAEPVLSPPARTGPPSPTSPAAGWASEVAAGHEHTCALTPAGGVLCWGKGRAAPMAVPGLERGGQAITAGGRHSCALLAGGKVQCWGDNDDGQLGNGLLYGGGGDIPVDVVGLGDGVQAISAGYKHTCALTAEGGVKCWGANYNGQIGNGVFGYYELTPVDVVGLTSGVQAISAGGAHTCALTASGGVQCWGNNYNGQLGDGGGGAGVWRATPVEVVGLTSGVRAIDAGSAHTCALTASGGMQCWGWNGGALGDGTTTTRMTPVAVIGLTSGVRAISAGGYHTCALTEQGGVQCWGDNYFGELGDGTQISHLTPIAPPALQSGFRALSLGLTHTCAVTAAGGVQCWGGNASGQLGDWTTTDRLSPVDVRLLTFACPAVTEIPAAECTALVALFVNTWGLGWTDRTGWLEAATPCAWRGVLCAEGHVRELNLAGNHLVGALPAAIGQLSALQTLDLSDNSLNWLPPELGNLGELRLLDLSDNTSYAMTIPPELGRLARLQRLDLSHAGFGAALPPELGQLSNLQTLDLSRNALTGTLPAAWSNLTALQTLDLHSNYLSGALPPELGQFATLQTLDLHANYLSGPIPAAWGQLTALQTLDLSNSGLGGPLPPELRQLTALQTLNLAHNHFDGALPAELGCLPALQTFDLHSNQFSGALPPQLSRLTALQHLDLGYNEFSGAIPPELGDLAALRNLFLDHNHLTGPIPPELGNLAALQASTPTAAHALLGRQAADARQETWLQVDAFSARNSSPASPLYSHPPPPPQWGYFMLSCNQLSGTLPVELGKLAKVRVFDLAGNQLRGTIPVALAWLGGYRWNLDYNLLSVNDPEWPSFLDFRDLITQTQTLAPTDVQAGVTDLGVALTWTPILYTRDAGYYEVSYAITPSGPFTVAGHTADKSAPGYTVTGLAPDRSYYFRVRTFTPVHEFRPYDCSFDRECIRPSYVQQSDLWSDYTSVVSIGGAPLLQRRWLPLIGSN